MSGYENVKLEYGPSALGHFFLKTPAIELRIDSAEVAMRIAKALLSWARQQSK